MESERPLPIKVPASLGSTSILMAIPTVRGAFGGPPANPATVEKWQTFELKGGLNLSAS